MKKEMQSKSNRAARISGLEKVLAAILLVGLLAFGDAALAQSVQRSNSARNDAPQNSTAKAVKTAATANYVETEVFRPHVRAWGMLLDNATDYQNGRMVDPPGQPKANAAQKDSQIQDGSKQQQK